jgi:hypothetical protein
MRYAMINEDFGTVKDGANQDKNLDNNSMLSQNPIRA